MITLLTFPAGPNIFAHSPFCVKARHLLTYAGVEWQREDMFDPRKTPFGKLPAIRLKDGQVIGDSGNIAVWLERQGTDFMPGLSARDKAHSRALVRLAEEHLYFILLIDRWGNDEIWPGIRDTAFAELFQPLRSIVASSLRRSILKGMKTQGLGRFSDAQRLERAEEDFTALAELIGERGFLFGDKPTLADMSVAPMLEGMAKSEIETPLSARVSGDAGFMDYLSRLDAALP